jgi:predicted ATP-grasp superfamily ATP-dependent carboligase
MRDGPAVLIAAASGRALAASARRAGYAPLVADFFADQDTVALAQAHVRLEDGLTRGMEERELLPALESLAAGREPIGIVCGTGFEDRPHLLALIARHWRILGNNADIVARTKDPEAFAAICAACGVPHPEIRLERPADTSDWLAKRRGGAGGGHISSTPAPGTARFYFQRRTAGMPISALLLADGRRAVVLGLSAQWSSPLADRPFRYGGAVQPARLAPALAAALADAAARVAGACTLVGLNSADFLVEGDQFRLLEINPRPGATLDIFEPPEEPLFALHVAACDGELSAVPPRRDGAAAAVIAYADRDIPSCPPLQWPAWTSDRPHAGTAIKAGEPLCTIHARAATAEAAQVLVGERLATVLASVHAAMQARMT